jgi:hypothetical protein
MGWLRQHKESRHVCGIALVVGEPGRFRVRLTEAEPRRLHEAPHWYSSLDIAFAAADAFTRHRLGGHKCNAACSGWVDPAEPN